MSDIAGYSFLPWLRRGVANTIISPDSPQNTAPRASIHVGLELTGDAIGGGGPLVQSIGQDVALYGPGDIVGIDARAVVRTEPRHWVTNFEPNFLAAIDFADEDFAWRYTPAAAVGDVLRPWITLLVLTEEEFQDERRAPGQPLPSIKVAPPAVFPPAGDLAAWAHVHCNTSLADPGKQVTDPALAVQRLGQVLAKNPDAAYCRLLSPRRLAEDTGYHAFVVPTFETGRRAGLGEDPGQVAATTSAWAGGGPRPDSHPVYYRWYFRTGSRGDFEYLVSLLKPRPVDPQVGSRDMDVTNPGAGLPGIADPGLGGVLRLGGALQVPEESLDHDQQQQRQAYENWDQPFPDPFQTALAAFIDLPDDYEAAAPGGDPLLTMPLYGRWHALTRRLLTNRDGSPAAHPSNWVHRLNLDPRFRVAAGLGAAVVEANAEEYMNDAWEQIGDVLAANLRIRRLQLAVEVAGRWYDGHLGPLLAASPERALALTAPVASRVLVGGVTAASLRAASTVPPVLTSTALRRVTRPGSRLMRSLPFDAARTPGNLLARVNAGAVSAAPPKVVPAGVVRLDQAAAAAPKGSVGIREGEQVPEIVDKLPRSPDFTLSVPGREQKPPGTGDRDGPIAERIKIALRDAYALEVASKEASQVPVPGPIDVGKLADTIVEALDPRVTIPRRGLTTIDLPPWVRDQVGDGLVEAMAYPRIDLPMYEPLKAISIELFLPNINLVPDNSVTLIETNRRFVESYMVGLNHEFGRKLLWREYPTDQRGSYFRQFWDVGAVIDTEGLGHDVLRERHYDIPELHTWDASSQLGQHQNPPPVPPDPPGPPVEQAVLVIRGELLKKYPTAVVYAHRAVWATNPDSSIDLSQPRSLAVIPPAQEDAPPHDLVRLPQYEAKADPDTTFFGFDLGVAEARGGTGEQPNDDPGWFFVIKERPGDPRFGLEVTREGQLEVFDELTWDDALPGAAPGQFLPANALHPLTLAGPAGPADPARQAQHADDEVVAGADPSSARWAYLLFRAPVMVAIHADELLGTGGS